MRRLFSTLAATVVLSVALPQAQSAPEGPKADAAPHAWFVQLASTPTADGTPWEMLADEEGRFHRAAAGAGIAYREARHYRTLWNGVTVQTDQANADRMRVLPGVRAVYPVVTATRAQQEPGGQDVAEMVTALAMTGADRIQNSYGYTGRKVRVAVMDSGIDYDHPDFGGCFGPGCRVEKGWDLVGDAFNPDRSSPSFNPTPVPDPLPDDCDGHGTHVAGIIGANGSVKGVAPKVTLHAYRVFGCVGPTTTDIMLEAMERAFADGTDILNISIGAPYQWPDYPTAQAADRLVRRGVVVVSSAGNEGANGLYAAAAPGIGRNTIGVASFDNVFLNLSRFTVTPDDRAIAYLPAQGTVPVPTAGAARLVRTGSPTSAADACIALPADSLTGRVALIRRGTCSFITKAANAQAAGAIAVVFYNDAPGRITIGVTGGTPIVVPVVSISGDDGVLLNERLGGGGVQLTWSSGTVQEPVPNGNFISAFSSYGPTADLAIKPDLGAPGGAIRSTLPLEQGGSGTISGTSMAAPYVSGAIALMLEALPDTLPADALTRLQNTAIPRGLSLDPSLTALDFVHRQGAGLIAVDKAILAPTTVTPSRLSLGEVEMAGAVRRVLHVGGEAPSPPRTSRRRRDKGFRGITYTLGHQPAPATGSGTYAPSVVLSYATVTFSTPTARDGSDVEVSITPPADGNARVFGGYITFTPDDEKRPVLRVPYLGYNGDYQSIRALTPTPANFPWLAKSIGPGLVRQPNGATFSMTGSDVPIVLFHLDHQVRLLQAVLIDGLTGQPLGLVSSQEFVGRNSTPTAFFSFTWNGTYTPPPDTTPRVAPNGPYRLDWSLLKANGDPTRPEHYEHWSSPPIVLARP